MGLFDFLHRKEKPLGHDIDLGVLRTDIHSHLIPGIDDGARDLETSLSLLRELEGLGYRKVITTPHVKSEVFPNDVRKLDLLCRDLRRHASEAGIGLDIEVGAEHFIDDSFMQRIEEGDLKIFGDNYLLVELPFYAAPFGLEEILFDLQINGYRLVLAHPERYLYWVDDFSRFTSLKDRGILFQMNIMSLSLYFGKPVLDLARRLIENNMVELLGSDTHHQKHIEAIKEALHSPLLDKLIQSGNIINSKF